MEAGKTSPILTAILDTESRLKVEVRVHISRRFIELNPMKRAFRIFGRWGAQDGQRMLLYVNVSKRKYAWVGHFDSNSKPSKRFWDKISEELVRNLRSTQYENAIAHSIRFMGQELANQTKLR
jgi:uncharacterized membrane protein